jgi:hypothetical protein
VAAGYKQSLSFLSSFKQKTGESRYGGDKRNIGNHLFACSKK